MHLPEETMRSCVDDLLRNAISSLKDEEYQKRVWFRAEGPEVDSYGEATINLISRCRYIFKNPSFEIFLRKENYESLKKLYDLVLEHLHQVESKYGDTDLLQEKELLDDPKWHDIQTLASELDLKLSEFVERKQE